MTTFRGLGACLLALLVMGCAPYGYNDYYSDYYGGYYGGYPYTGSTYLSYYGGYPYYYHRPWYGYPPWYWYDRDHDDDDDDDDHHHRPPHHGDDDRERAEYLMRQRRDPADVPPEAIARNRQAIADLPINMADRIPRDIPRRRPVTRSQPSGIPQARYQAPRGNAEAIRRQSIGRGDRGDQWQR